MDNGAGMALPIILATVFTVTGCAGTHGSEQGADTRRLSVHMTDSDIHLADSSIQRALEYGPSNSRHVWRNEDNGHTGEIRPVRTFRVDTGAYCRVYEETLRIGDRMESYRDTACRDAAGVWRVLE